MNCKEIIGSVVEEKLKEALGDPDSGLDIRADVRDQLLRQQDEVRNGERGEDLVGVAERLRLT